MIYFIEVYRVYDRAGALTALEYDLKGNLLSNESAYVRHAADPEQLRTWTVDGEGLGATASDTDHRGQIYRVYDTAGALIALEYDFKPCRILQEAERVRRDAAQSSTGRFG